MGLMMLVWLVVLVLLALVLARLATRQLPSGFQSDSDRRLADQAEEIERLQEEVKRVKEQADFTERLLTERGEAEDEEKP